MANPRNLIGPQLRRLRVERELSQPQFARICQRNGWDLSRDTLAKIEGQLRWVADFEVIFLANALGVVIKDLLPEDDTATAKEFILRLERNLE